MGRPTREYLKARMRMLEEELFKLESRPEDEYENGTVLAFDKTFGKHTTTHTTYHYAAVKARGSWWLTGGQNTAGMRSWDSLWDFIEYKETEDTMPTVYWVSSMEAIN